MKIAYLRTKFWFNFKGGGSVAHTLGVLGAFKKSNHDLFVLTNEKFFGIDDFNHFVFEPKIKKPTHPGELLYNFYAKKRIKKEIRKFQPEFIYQRAAGYSFLGAKIAKELKIPLVLEFNGFDTWILKYYHQSKNPFSMFLKYLLSKIVKKIEDYNLKNSSLIVTVSEPLKKDLIKRGVPEEKILVNPNGVDPEKFNPEMINAEKSENLKQKLGIAQNKIVVGFTGTFGEWHGIPQFIEAIDRILKNKLSLNIYFLLIGKGKLKPEAEKQVGHYKNVKFLGEIPYSNIQSYLNICDIFVSPHNLQIDGKEFFGSPTKLFEYMAMGKGIVASNLGQISKVLEKDRTAILVKPGNVEELIEGILKLAKDKNLREKLGDNARNEVILNYTWQKNIERLMEKLNG